LASRSILVHAELGADPAFPPAAVARTIASHASDSLEAGKFGVDTRALSNDDIGHAIRAMPWGHERLCLDETLILVDAGALLAHAPYRARVILTGDPFASAEMLSSALGLELDAVRTRLHDGLVGAERVVVLSGTAFQAVAPLTNRLPERLSFPPFALKTTSSGSDPVLVVDNDLKGDAAEALLSTLREAVPGDAFEAFDPASALAKPWKAVVQVGIAAASLPGARLRDAWAGSVPVLQLLNRQVLEGYVRRQTGSLAEMVVEHGKNGLQFFSLDDLAAALRDFAVDSLPLRSVARAARRKIDPAALWDELLKAVLQ